MDRIYTRPEIAEMFQVSEKTVSGWLQSGKLEGAFIAQKWLVKETDLNNFIEDHKVDGKINE